MGIIRLHRLLTLCLVSEGTQFVPNRYSQQKASQEDEEESPIEGMPLGEPVGLIASHGFTRKDVAALHSFHQIDVAASGYMMPVDEANRIAKSQNYKSKDKAPDPVSPLPDRQ